MVSKKALTGLQAAALVMGFALVTGCASTSQIEQAQSDAQQALQIAQEAQRTAQEATAAARAAQQSADAANRCCSETQQKLDRLLERSQQK